MQTTRTNSIISIRPNLTPTYTLILYALLNMIRVNIRMQGGGGEKKQ